MERCFLIGIVPMDECMRPRSDPCTWFGGMGVDKARVLQRKCILWKRQGAVFSLYYMRMSDFEFTRQKCSYQTIFS